MKRNDKKNLSNTPNTNQSESSLVYSSCPLLLVALTLCFLSPPTAPPPDRPTAASMSAAIFTFSPPVKPNPISNLQRARSALPRPSASWSLHSRSEPLPAFRTDLRRTSLSNRCFGGQLVSFGRRMQSLLLFAAHEESDHLDIEVEKEKELQNKADGSQEAWKQTLESFKEEARKMKKISQEAYEVYSKRALVILKETSEALKIEAEKATHDIGIIAKEISKEGQVYLTIAAENSPESVKDIVETFASLPNELKGMRVIRDFYLGIPYGASLAIGGFLNFMLTGSITAIRFGIILGSALLALSISSLRSRKSGQSSQLFLKGQAAIATVIFIREWKALSKVQSFPTFWTALISGAMVAFFLYRIIMDESTESPTLDEYKEK